MDASLVLFGTGLSNVRALMAFHVPRYQKIAGMGLLSSLAIALYVQASKPEQPGGAGAGEGWWEVLIVAFLLGSLRARASPIYGPILIGAPLRGPRAAHAPDTRSTQAGRCGE